MHPSDTLLVTVYTAPAQSLSAAEPPRKAPGCEGRHSHQFGWNLVLKTKSGTKAFFGRGQRYRRLAVQHPVGSCCFPDATGRTFSVLSGMDKTSRSASVRVDRWHTGGALALNQAVPQCHRRPRSGNATGIHSNLWWRNLLPSPPLASWLSAPSAAALADRLCSEPQLLPAASRSLLAR